MLNTSKLGYICTSTKLKLGALTKRNPRITAFILIVAIFITINVQTKGWLSYKYHEQSLYYRKPFLIPQFFWFLYSLDIKCYIAGIS